MFKKKNEVKQKEIKTPVESVDTEEYEEKGSIVNSIVNGFLVFAIILAAICTYVSFVSSSGNGVPSILGIRPFSIQTESMYPTLEPGDLIISTSVEPEELRIDDIITYWTVINGEEYGIILDSVSVDEDNRNNLFTATIKYKYSQQPSL